MKNPTERPGRLLYAAALRKEAEDKLQQLRDSTCPRAELVLWTRSYANIVDGCTPALICAVQALEHAEGAVVHGHLKDAIRDHRMRCFKALLKAYGINPRVRTFAALKKACGI